jgi:predicted Rossmann-fold nucleotide-binding protein
MSKKKDKTSDEFLTTLKWLKTEEKPAIPKITYNDKSLEKIGEILKGQGWVELHGHFTPSELESLIDDIKEKNKNIPNGNT